MPPKRTPTRRSRLHDNLRENHDPDVTGNPCLWWSSEGGAHLELRVMLEQADVALLEAKHAARTPLGEAAVKQ